MSNELEDRLIGACEVLSQEARELYLSEHVAEIQDLPSPLTFYREYVSRNLPVIIRGGARQWSAIKKWSISYFRETLGDKVVVVAVTPNGYADAIATKFSENGEEAKEYFVMPEERLLPMNEFLAILENPTEDSVFYIQRQNSNFHDFPELWMDAVTEVPWASEAFGNKPDAVNIWIGDSRAVTSMHKDPYENVYCVISGEKEFILHPPTDLPWIPYRKYPTAHYKETRSRKWDIQPVFSESVRDDDLGYNADSCNNSDFVPWICIDPLNPDYQRYPQYKKATTLRAIVRQGDMLYLPSLWFHHVRQSHGCIALNYWYDMDYDIKYAYYKTLENLCKR